jgi:hypothetical protein
MIFTALGWSAASHAEYILYAFPVVLAVSWVVTFTWFSNPFAGGKALGNFHSSSIGGGGDGGIGDGGHGGGH